MSITRNKLVFIVLAGVVALFLYFYGGAIINGGMEGMMSENNKLVGNSFGIVPALFIFCFGVFIGWLLFRKKW
jgi:glucan phosphoethanolaminetransferase (alkaline phosphatase superfamily)